MLKVRLMGTKNDIAWFQKILQRHPKIEAINEQIQNIAQKKDTLCRRMYN